MEFSRSIHTTDRFFRPDKISHIFPLSLKRHFATALGILSTFRTRLPSNDELSFRIIEPTGRLDAVVHALNRHITQRDDASFLDSFHLYTAIQYAKSRSRKFYILLHFFFIIRLSFVVTVWWMTHSSLFSRLAV